jgi:hypothetical protein
MDRTEEQVRAGCQRGRRDRNRLADGKEVERAEEECWRGWSAGQDLIQPRDDPAPTELRDLRERVRLAATVRDNER